LAKKTVVAIVVVALIAVLALVAVGRLLNTETSQTPPTQDAVPHEGEYGLYVFDLATEKVKLLYSTDNEIYTSALRLNTQAGKLAFAQKTGGANDENMEIYTVDTNGENLKRLTDNSYMDLYPAWSPDGTRIAFLSRRDSDLDIYMMNADGSDQHLFYDSGLNDADIDWAGDTIVFTSGFKIWSIRDDGTGLAEVTSPADAGQWGTANLPIGDYDPRLTPDGSKIVFERLEDPESTHGRYNIFTVNSDGTEETRLTDTNYAQGLGSWSHSADRIVYGVAAINDEGKYDMYLMNSDGSDSHSITPECFAASFLCHSPIFSQDDSEIYFIGQWYQ
jgi:Tol biopolymer transport system component